MSSNGSTESHQALKQIYIDAAKEAGFTDDDLPDFWYIVIRRWIEQRIRENKVGVFTHEYRTHREEMLKELLKEVSL